MSIYTLIALLLVSTSAQAATDAEIAMTCLGKGKEKIALQANAFGCAVDLQQVEVLEVDNRWYNPSKYIWYFVPGECAGFEGITQMVQYYRGSCR